MSVRRHLGFGSTLAFRNLYPQVARLTDNAGRLAYANYDPSLGEPPNEVQLELLQNYKCDMPTITFTGSEKLHGENMAVCYSQGELWVQGRNHIRTLLGDQNGMAQFVESTKDQWLGLFMEIGHREELDDQDHTIVIDCEWAGGNIQKGNAACSGTDKGAYIFDYCRVVNNDTNESEYKSTEGLFIPTDSSIYLMSSFASYSAVLDFNEPSQCEKDLERMATAIEDSSPIAAYFDKPNNVGEGAYLWATYNGNVLRLKAKGLKHGGKPKVPRENSKVLSSEDAKEINAFAEAVTPVWRITQAIAESGATEHKHIGMVIKWVLTDIAKEEGPLIAAITVEYKKTHSTIISIVKAYYLDSLKEY